MWWPLLTVETEGKGYSKRTNERDPFLVGSLGLPCLYKRFLFSLGCSSRPSSKYFFSSTFLIPLFPIAQPAGQEAVLGRLSLIVFVSG